ncbi:MAG: hypothetical protein LBB67_00475 [Oscillospiraceae bacterium]|jgi:hypothetical protein|nr:hypothetical protein [Oscillospiraceae bacterium]
MWSEGIIARPKTGGKYKYWVKHFEEGSQFGIDGGRISKLVIRKVGESEDLVCYDRGWGKKPKGKESKAVCAIILSKFNDVEQM